MPDLIYTDPRLAAIYDALNPPDEDTAFYLALAGTKSRHILDIGCGTGYLACALAEMGHQVTGADPATARRTMGSSSRSKSQCTGRRTW